MCEHLLGLRDGAMAGIAASVRGHRLAEYDHTRARATVHVVSTICVLIECSADDNHDADRPRIVQRA